VLEDRHGVGLAVRAAGIGSHHLHRLAPAYEVGTLRAGHQALPRTVVPQPGDAHVLAEGGDPEGVVVRVARGPDLREPHRLAPSLPVGRERAADVAISVGVYIEHLVATGGLGLPRIEADAGPVRPARHQVVVLRAFELHQPQVRLGPRDPVTRLGVAHAHLAHFGIVLRLRPVGDGRAADRIIDDERAVPTLIKPTGGVAPNVGVQVVVADLPGLVLSEQRIRGVLLRLADPQRGVLHARHDTSVEQ